jgi:SEC-C motif-containing protein
MKSATSSDESVAKQSESVHTPGPMTTTSCPCGTGKNYSTCCEPLLEGRQSAPTAEALMRSRYTAYVKGAIPYIFNTSAPESRQDFDEAGVSEWSQRSEWRGLEIKRVEAGAASDTHGTVEFVARYALSGEEHAHHEVAEFRKTDGTWFFVDERAVKGPPSRRDAPKVGRNDLCPCGSGQKFKKCCAA